MSKKAKNAVAQAAAKDEAKEVAPQEEFTSEEWQLMNEIASWPQLPTFTGKDDGSIAFATGSGPHAVEFNVARLAKVFGVKSDEEVLSIAHVLANLDSAPGAKSLNCNVQRLAGIAPQNTLESMMGVQMVGCHNAATEFLRRALRPDQTTAGVDLNVNRATKLLRTFTAQVEALQKLRGKGQQTVRVEHVTVNAGGQAIVGHVEHKAGGEGGIG